MWWQIQFADVPPTAGCGRTIWGRVVAAGHLAWTCTMAPEAIGVPLGHQGLGERAEVRRQQ